ncbi:MAG: 2-oxoacid:ferredoxin oxidoreductase subunit beta [Candidatus Eisenbacteria bacterium]|nr:2-oxoacid:ferredoxin oxidoreductase subunit beta [Candidatus Eisenbacteria bacterium]
MNPKDYRSALAPVWCPGCGDFGVLKGLTQALSDLEVPTEKLGMISGIGCSSRLVGYLNAYSFNSVHGRALPVATGLKLARPDLTVVVVGGDGDGFSIGIGHVPHAVRRDVDITYAVMDNGIYGLTKGQASPTTELEVKRGMGLAGVDERPINPALFTLSSGCGFVARTHAGNLPHVRQMLREAIQHPGFAFVHILAACATYQMPGYAEKLFQRCEMLPDDYDPTDFSAATAAADTTGDRFRLGILYRRPVEQKLAAPADVTRGRADNWSPLGGATEAEETAPGDRG